MYTVISVHKQNQILYIISSACCILEVFVFLCIDDLSTFKNIILKRSLNISVQKINGKKQKQKLKQINAFTQGKTKKTSNVRDIIDPNVCSTNIINSFFLTDNINIVWTHDWGALSNVNLSHFNAFFFASGKQTKNTSKNVYIPTYTVFKLKNPPKQRFRLQRVKCQASIVQAIFYRNVPTALEAGRVCFTMTLNKCTS